MTGTASILVIIAVLVNIAALMWLLGSLRRKRGESSTTTETTGHIWDGDLRELNNPLPRWWLWLFVLTTVFGLGYMAVYPGLGNFAGAWGWTSQRQFDEQSAEAEKLMAHTFEPYEHQSAAALASNPQAVRIGRNLFVNNCAACHGSDGRGAPGFPNLSDHDWLWGGTPEAIVQSIGEGRISTMPAWRDALGGDSGVEDVLRYVMSLSGRDLPAGDLDSGRAKFTAICAACHGADGHGKELLGAPNLTDHIWLNGGTVATVRTTIATGRHAEMPAHLARLGQTRVNLLAAYIISLGGIEPAPAAAVAQPAAPAAAAPSASPAVASAAAATLPQKPGGTAP